MRHAADSLTQDWAEGPHGLDFDALLKKKEGRGGGGGMFLQMDLCNANNEGGMAYLIKTSIFLQDAVGARRNLPKVYLWSLAGLAKLSTCTTRYQCISTIVAWHGITNQAGHAPQSKLKFVLSGRTRGLFGSLGSSTNRTQAGAAPACIVIVSPKQNPAAFPHGAWGFS